MVVAILTLMGILKKLFGKDKETSTDILELLASQHAEVDALFKRLDEAHRDRGVLFIELADKLGAHAAVEEELFYPAVMAKGTSDLLHESVEEHLSIKRLLADLIALRAGTKEFDAKLLVLKEQVTHHAHKEEEAKLFPKVRSMFDADERAALGGEFLARFESKMKTHPYKTIPAEIKAAAELPKP